MTKITHRVPLHACGLKSDPITPEYQAEIDRTMIHAEAAYKRAQKRLRAAERRLARAQHSTALPAKKRRRQIQELEALVELRRLEMEQTHRLMVATGAPSPNRGKHSYRNVPASKVL